MANVLSVFLSPTIRDEHLLAKSIFPETVVAVSQKPLFEIYHSLLETQANRSNLFPVEI